MKEVTRVNQTEMTELFAVKIQFIIYIFVFEKLPGEWPKRNALRLRKAPERQFV